MPPNVMRAQATYKPVSVTNRWIALLAVSLALCAGCYDGSEMVKQAQTVALKTRLAEVDLGKFQTTLPRDPVTNHFTALDIHIFGTVPRYQLAAVTKQLKDDEYRVRHETLAAIRKSSREELAEPTFAQLRARIEKVVNEVLKDAPVKEVGFYQVTLRSP
jgi:hypothetical protein